MKPRAMWLFYAAWLPMCLVSFITSTVLGFIVVCLGVIVRLLELNLISRRQNLSELQRTTRELRAVRQESEVWLEKLQREAKDDATRARY